jgi:ubiquinone biosynthesis monooxygenase Coq7
MTPSLDQWLSLADRALRSLGADTVADRPYPVAASSAAADGQLSAAQRGEAAALMRVNHVGEVCAQALYEAQAIGTNDPQLRQAFLKAAEEERAHLAWTQRRLDELNGRASVLNPLWYAGSFAIGWVASRFGDAVSLGFMAETERQVEQHLQSHLERLPAADAASRDIVRTMQAEEGAHGAAARALGGAELPLPIRWVMRAAAKVMTITAQRL